MWVQQARAELGDAGPSHLRPRGRRVLRRGLTWLPEPCFPVHFILRQSSPQTPPSRRLWLCPHSTIGSPPEPHAEKLRRAHRRAPLPKFSIGEGDAGDKGWNAPVRHVTRRRIDASSSRSVGTSVRVHRRHRALQRAGARVDSGNRSGNLGAWNIWLGTDQVHLLDRQRKQRGGRSAFIFNSKRRR